VAKISVVCGGNSDEREISLLSGAAVATALEAAGHTVVKLDLAAVSIEEIIDADVVFPVLHGKDGEDGKFQALLEAHNARFVGSGSTASALCANKEAYRNTVSSHAKLPEGAVVGLADYQGHRLASAPFILKPIDGGSSIGMHIVRDPTIVPIDEIAKTFDKYGMLLMEQLIIGTELTVGVLGDESIGIVEIIPPQDGSFDYENKYNGATQELCPPQHIDPQTQAKALEISLNLHHLTGCRDFSRTDMMIDGTSGELYVLETNTIPGMTTESLFPKIAAVHGLVMPALCDRLVQMALSR
jgi:D-alanine-D-alanine ligase